MKGERERKDESGMDGKRLGKFIYGRGFTVCGWSWFFSAGCPKWRHVSWFGPPWKSSWLPAIGCPRHLKSLGG